VLAATVPATAALAQPAAHHPAVAATTKIVNRYDGGGGGYWAYDTFTRAATNTYLGMDKTGHPATPYEYTATLQDNGTFKDIPGALTPNQGTPYTGRVLKPAQVSGTMAGYGQFAVFYASAKARKGLAPTALKGKALNLLYPSSTWPELLFPAGTTFAGVSETGYSYTYSVTLHKVVKVNGKKVTKTSHQKWVDSAWNGDGQLKRDGNITG
jgi:hypothetical protein